MTNHHSATRPLPLDAESLASVLESFPDALAVTTTTGDIVYLNAAAKRLLGTSLNEARGRPLAEYLTLLDGATHQPVAAPLTRCLARSEIERRDYGYDLVRRRDGSELPVEDRCTVLRGANGEAAGLLLVLRDATALRELARAASHDSLTHLVNRAEFERRLARLLGCMRPGEAHALLYMDLDHFKAINVSHGHAAGDSVLRQVADRLGSLIRERDTLARLGGDEFVLLSRALSARARPGPGAPYAGGDRGAPLHLAGLILPVGREHRRGRDRAAARRSLWRDHRRRSSLLRRQATRRWDAAATAAGAFAS